MSDTTTLNPAIHAAFRRDLERLDHGFAAYDPSVGGAADQLSATWAYFSHQLHAHHHDEEAFFWPAFRDLGVDPAIIRSLEDEHVVMVAALGSADDAMQTFAMNPSAEHGRAARSAIAELKRVLYDHLAHEQRDLDPFSIRHKNTPQHKAAERAARKAHTEGAGNFFAWLLDDADAETTRIVRREVPPPVLWLLTRIGGRRYRSLARNGTGWLLTPARG